ncbi:MAG: hypothetical protein R8G60_03390 [Roseovarius pacificus]|nr:hypothetical protein [Roseovarius pacificus]
MVAGPWIQRFGRVHVDPDLIGMRQRVGQIGDPKLPAPFKFAIPFDLVIERGVEPRIGQFLVLALRRCQHLGKEALRAVLPLGGIDRKRAHNGLGHRHGHVAIAIAHGDVAIGFIEDNALQPLLVELWPLVLRAP